MEAIELRGAAVISSVWRAAVLVLAAFICVSAPSAARAQTASLEDSVKATFLYRFASFVTWPTDAFAAADSAITICVMGEDPFRRLLETSVRDQTIAGRAIAVRQLATAEGVTACHILYLGAGEQATEQALRAARSAPILTVTDADETPNTRGVIHFVVLDQRVRFHIDDARAAESGLAISSRLLNLAVSVRRRARA